VEARLRYVLERGDLELPAFQRWPSRAMCEAMWLRGRRTLQARGMDMGRYAAQRDPAAFPGCGPILPKIAIQ